MSGITEVIDNLYISGLESQSAIANKGIRAVFNISSECPVQHLGPNIDYEKISLPDLPTASIQVYFDRLTDRIEQNLQQGKKTLVHCYVGRSRSATIILAYLMKYQQMSLREAFYFLRSRRSIIGPNFGFIKQLINYERSLLGSTTVSFVETSLGSVPDIYLSMDSTPMRRRPPSTPIPISTKSSARLHSFNEHSPFSVLSSRSSSYLKDPLDDYRRPGSSSLMNSALAPSSSYTNSSFLHQPPPRLYSTASLSRPSESMREPYFRARMNALRSDNYLPAFFNRSYFP